MILLTILLAVMLVFNHWLLEPLTAVGEALFELQVLPWLGLAVLAWLLAGRRD